MAWLDRNDLVRKRTATTVELLDHEEDVDGATVNRVDTYLESTERRVRQRLRAKFSKVQLDALSEDPDTFEEVKAVILDLAYYELWAQRLAPKDPADAIVKIRDDAEESLAAILSRKSIIDEDEANYRPPYRVSDKRHDAVTLKRLKELMED